MDSVQNPVVPLQWDFVFVYFHFSVPPTEVTDLITDEKIY